MSQKVISDVYVLSAAVFNGIIRHVDFTLIIT
jgi:thymidylate kinase